MTENTQKSIKKALCFEKNGETFAVEISIANVPPKRERDTIIRWLDELYVNAKMELCSHFFWMFSQFLHNNSLLIFGC